VIAGITTAAAVQASVNQVSIDRVRLLIGAGGVVVTDDLDRLVAPTQAHLVWQVGEDALGARGRIDLPAGVALLGGFAYGRLDAQDIVVANMLTGAIALRWAPPGVSRPFVELGALAGGSDDLVEQRAYANGHGVAMGQGAAPYRSAAYWARMGWVWDPSPDLQVGAYVEYGRARQSIGGYVEPLSGLNPFEAAIGPSRERLDPGKLGLRYDRLLPGGWELFGGLALAHGFGASQSLPVDVDGFGALTAAPPGAPTWVEYRVRVGRRFAPATTLSLYVAGVAGARPVGDDAVVGLDLRRVF
jgi:hypothetical protein